MSPTKKKKTAQKKTKKAPARKKTGGKKASKKAPGRKAAAKKKAAKPAAKKKVAKKAAPAKKKAAKAPPAKKKVAKKAAPAKARKRAPAKKRSEPEPAPTSPLGVKYTCFKCNAKFYDLNRPEPICPKCGADQRERPKPARGAAGSGPSRPSIRPMAPLLDDEEDTRPRDADEDIGIEGQAKPRTGDEFFDDAEVAPPEIEPEAEED